MVERLGLKRRQIKMNKKKRTFLIVTVGIIMVILAVGNAVVGFSDEEEVRGRSENNDGVVGWTGASDKSGVFGHSDTGVGVTGRSKNNGGVVGWTGASDKYKSGVFGWSDKNGRGVVGRSDNNDGVVGWTGASNKTGVFGHGDTGVGVTGLSHGDNHGIFGATFSSNPDHAAVFGRNNGAGSGVYGEARGIHGHAGYFFTTQGERLAGAAVYAHSSNPHGIALYARNDGSDDVTAAFINMGTGYLIKGFGGDGGEHEFAVHNDGKVWTEGGIQVVGDAKVITPVLQITGGSDLSELFEVRETKEKLLPSPGMVVSIDPESPGDLIVSDKAYDRCVAGIISGAGDIAPGIIMGQFGSVADGVYQVALTGRVYCWADASNGPIEPGDLLTTSDTPGHAMKITDYTRAQGAVIGKAMSSLESGQGLVLVLVSLQ
jgi:hypothetical protein